MADKCYIFEGDREKVMADANRFMEVHTGATIVSTHIHPTVDMTNHKLVIYWCMVIQY